MALEKFGNHIAFSTPDSARRSTGEDAPDKELGATLEHIPAEKAAIGQVIYGKLVDASGAVTAEGYGVTAKTAGISQDTAQMIRATNMLGISMFDTSDIKPGAEKIGALIIRTLKDNVVVQRVRFRPENGEEARGRQYQQASSLLIPVAFWQRNASQLAAKVCSLRAIPDSKDVARTERFDKEPQVFESNAHDISTLEGLDANARFIADALLTDTVLQFPPERFPDEESFLVALGKAIETVACIDPEKVSGLGITAGINKLGDQWIQF